MKTTDFNNQLIALQDSLLRYAYSLTSNRDEAQDLVQETVLKALKYARHFVQDTNLKAWTFTIMKNTYINHYNRLKRQNLYYNKSKEEMHRNMTTSRDDPDSAYSSKELEKIIDSLDDHLKTPFKMHHEGFKYKEIADELDLKLGTVKSRIFFTRKKIMQQLSL